MGTDADSKIKLEELAEEGRLNPAESQQDTVDTETKGNVSAEKTGSSRKGSNGEAPASRET